MATLGADPLDSDERRFRKALLVVIAVLILPILLNTGDPGAKRKEAVSRRPPPDTWGGLG